VVYEKIALGVLRTKSAISPKRLKVERKLLLAAYKVVHGLSSAAKMYDLELPLGKIQGH